MTDRTDSDPPFGIYLHWPFCESRCPYCDFNAYASDFDTETWTSAYLRQLESAASEIGGRICQSVFFGGGTPSLMHPSLVAAVLNGISRDWSLADDAEITLEANPSSSEAARFADYRDAGVSRVSIGVQSLRRAGLASLGRLHTAEDARAAFEAATRAFGRVSIDLIFGRQGQSLSEWNIELRDAVEWGADHLSLYQLTIEPGTAFWRRRAAGGLPGLPDEDLAADMQIAAEDICAQSGYRLYEVSNYAKPGCEGRHNLLYWRCHDVLGIGPGAHGRITVGSRRAATETFRSPDEWLQSVAERGSGESRRVWLTAEDQAYEYLLMSLRLGEGADLQRMREFPAYQPRSDIIRQLQDDGLLDAADGRLRTTRQGRLVLNSVLRSLTGWAGQG